MLSFLLSPLLKWLPKLVPYVLAAAAVVGGVWYVDHRAYQRGYDTAVAAQEAAAADEAARVAAANRRAVVDAMRAIDRLTREKEARDAQIAELLRQGAADPDAGNTALSSGSVRRLNQLD